MISGEEDTAVAGPTTASTTTLCARCLPGMATVDLRSDNGSAFVADEVRAFLAAHGVMSLLSAAYTPRYKGACEAVNGTIKHLTHHLACRHDRPASWTLDDLEAARLLANHRITDRTQCCSPEQRFADRVYMSMDERQRFQKLVAPTWRPARALSIWPRSLICTRGAWSAGPVRPAWRQRSSSRLWTWP